MILVDTNILLDVFTNDPRWAEWSGGKLADLAAETLAINPVVFAELSPAFREASELNGLLDPLGLVRLPLPYDAAFAAGQAFVRYRARGGAQRRPMPDFLVGAHALTAGLRLLTRDARRYRTYFPGLELICP